MASNSQSPWIPVGELQNGFAISPNILIPTDDLVGKHLTIYFADGTVIAHHFTNSDKLTWTIQSGNDAGESVTETYHATSLRDGIYFVDFIKSAERAMSVTLVLDLNKHVFTATIAQMPIDVEAKKSLIERVANNEELTGVTAQFAHGTIDKPYCDNGQLHTETNELVGKRVLYTYSPHEQYEHIYLNPNQYTWQCVQGVEKGLADTDSCHAYKIADELYLFVWREKIIPTIGVVMIDFARKKTTGKIMGYAENNFGTLSNFQIGVFARVFNTTNDHQYWGGTLTHIYQRTTEKYL